MKKLKNVLNKAFGIIILAVFFAFIALTLIGWITAGLEAIL
tara:strand:+ start:680 stop:802 length:123 start_codon:yes stop_codon:yes gene_type:complete